MTGKRLKREKITIRKMLRLYGQQCPEASQEPLYYEQLFVYAAKRLDRCAYGEEKPACKHCPIHCYQPARREEMKNVMRWSGPRMLWRHPVLTILHLVDDRRPVPPLPEKYQRKR